MVSDHAARAGAKCTLCALIDGQTYGVFTAVPLQCEDASWGNTLLRETTMESTPQLYDTLVYVLSQQATRSCDVVMCAGVVNIFWVSERLEPF